MMAQVVGSLPPTGVTQIEFQAPSLDLAQEKTSAREITIYLSLCLPNKMNKNLKLNKHTHTLNFQEWNCGNSKEE